MTTQQEVYETILIPYKILFEHRSKFDVWIDTSRGNSDGRGVNYILQQDAYNEVKKILDEVQS